MKHLDFSPTPISKLSFFSQKLKCNIFAKRDDLFTEAGGGSKARMLQYILADVNSSNTNVLITAGGPCSNFNRACALMCAKIGVPMHLIEYTDMPEEFNTSLNYFLCNLADIRKTRCEKNNVPSTIKEVVQSYQGQNVKTIYGGGKSLEGIYSYYDAVYELSNQIENIDHVFVSCGTGTTLTGICAGMNKFFPNAQVHAISVARTFEVEKPTLEDDMKILNTHLGSSCNFDNMKFYEEYLCGGYDHVTPELLSIIKECISKEGMIVDPCYSGKSLYGMNEIIKMNMDEYKGKNVVYWNTGGIINLLSMKDEYEFEL